MEELENRVARLSPDVIFLTETWLDDNIPDNCVSVSDFTIARKDRNKFGGRIMLYIRVNFHYFIIQSECVPSLLVCESEMLPVVFSSLNLLMIGVYHPFGRMMLNMMKL